MKRDLISNKHEKDVVDPFSYMRNMSEQDFSSFI